MNVLEKNPSRKRALDPAGKVPKRKVHWRCCVPSCNSKKYILRYGFPKDERLSKAWQDIIKNPDLNGLTATELRNYRVCQLHFSKDAYSLTTNVRQRLRNDAVPTLLLCTNMSDPSINTELQDNSAGKSAVESENLQYLNNGLEKVVSVNLEQDIVMVIDDTNTLSQPSSSKKDSTEEGGRTVSCSTPKTKRPLLGSITRKNKLTPVASNLYEIASDLKKRQSKYIRKLGSFRRRLRLAEEFAKGVQMKELQSLPKDQLTLIESQIRNIHKKVKARRFTVDDYVLALAIFKQSAQAYRLLSRIFILPTSRSLQTFLCRIHLKPGVNQIIINHLKKQGEGMTDIQKVCYLMWDEMSIDSQVYYDKKGDKIVGFEDWGNARSNKFADHALVFILQGIQRKWMIPLSYNFAKSCTSAKQLRRCIIEIVEAVKAAGFEIVATVCDQGATNVACINKFLAESKAICLAEGKQFMAISGQNIIPLYDPPHLLKGMRNNFLNKDIEIIFPNQMNEESNENEHYRKIKELVISNDFIKEIEELKKNRQVPFLKEEKYFASWSTLELVYDIDNTSMYTTRKQLTKVHDGHIKHAKIRKMRVNVAAQTLSATVAGFIRFLTCINGSITTVHGPKSVPITDGISTAVVVQFLNNLFDSVNGSKHQNKRDRNDLRREVTDTSVHMLFWKEAVACLQNNLQFVDRVTKKAKSIPSLQNWIQTLNGFQNLWQILQEKGFQEFFPGHINQDGIENFFGMVRSHGRRNINPTCRQFEASFKSLLINSLTSAKTVKGNCKSDNCEVLFSLRDFALSAHNIAVDENEKIENEQYMLFNDNESDNTDRGMWGKTV